MDSFAVEPRADRGALLKNLEGKIDGDLLLDELSRSLYSTDASIYQIQPLGIVLPASESDIIQVMAFCREQKIPLLPRAGGTSLAGQTVGECLVMDFSKYYNQVVEYSPEERRVKVQPGLVLDELNSFLKKDRLHFAPDPATSSRAGIGGMIANNSSGTKSILYGKTIDHLISLRVLLSDGTICEFGPTSQAEVNSLAGESNRKGEIYRQFRDLIFRNTDAILEHFPKTMRRVSGYPLDEFAGADEWNLAKIFAGSEGTLAIILEATLNLEPLPDKKGTCLVHFDNLMDSIRAVEHILPYNPAAVELINDDVLELSRGNRQTAHATTYLHGKPTAVQLVEFYGGSLQEIESRAKAMADRLQSLGLGYAFPFFPEGGPYNEIWAMRKKGLGILMGLPDKIKPLAFIEDGAVPIPVLPDYIRDMLDFCRSKQVRIAAYAHASVGVIHLRPFLDISDPEDIVKMREISAYAFERVKFYGGSWSSEHGDGLSRGEYIRQFFGDQVFGAFKEVKEIFDPLHLLNPPKMTDPPPMDKNLRQGTFTLPADFEPQYHYRKQKDFEHAVLQCTGIGVCRKSQGGTMCPSYMATRDEEHSTRGRANALRSAIEGNLDLEKDRRLHEVFDLCLSCKACKSECPSNVDMARLKSELLHYSHEKGGANMAARQIRNSSGLARRLSGGLAPLVNIIQSGAIFRHLIQGPMGFDSRRKLPKYAKEKFQHWFKKHNKKDEEDEKEIVCLFADTYLNYHETTIGKAAIGVLEKLGMRVELISGFCCQRPAISNGFLKHAKKEVAELLNQIEPIISSGRKILVCEPSCHSAFIDDLPDLIDDEHLALAMKQNILPLETFVLAQIEKNGTGGLGLKHDRVFLHGHCHQKALTGTASIHSIFQLLGASEVIEPDSGCCGMAGAFGYEKGHYDISQKIGERVLFPAIRNETSADGEIAIAASGFSCRHQIKDFTGKASRHWIELITYEN